MVSTARIIPNDRDIINAYRLAFGRDPEADSVVDEKILQRNADWFPGFFTSPEFVHEVRERVATGGHLRGGYFDSSPSSDLIDWVKDFAPLERQSRERMKARLDWHGLFHILFSDPAFLATIFPDRGGGPDRDFIAALEAEGPAGGGRWPWKPRSRPRTRWKSVAGRSISTIPGGPLQLQVWIDDAFVAAGTTRIFRRDIQDRSGERATPASSCATPCPSHARGKAVVRPICATRHRASSWRRSAWPPPRPPSTRR